MITIGERLREALDRPENKNAKKNVPYLAQKTGITKQNFYNILNGLNNNPSDDLLKQVSDELNVDFYWLKYGETKQISLTDPDVLPHLSEEAKQLVLDPKYAALINTMTLVKDKNWRTWDQKQWDLINKIIKLALDEIEKLENSNL